jgi:hypothetical protein
MKSGVFIRCRAAFFFFSSFFSVLLLNPNLAASRWELVVVLVVV